MTESEATDVLDGVKIIDCDAHFTEPPDLWTSRVPDSLKDLVPVQKTIDGSTAWYLDDQLWCAIGGNTIEHGRRKVLGEHILQPWDRIDTAAWDVNARLEIMDDMGIHAAIIYPNAVGFSSNHIFAIEDTGTRLEVLKTYNDFYVDLQVESGERLLPQAMLPVWDMDLTVKEMERLMDKGMRGFTLTDKPEMINLPELDTDYYAPMWSLANEAGVVMNFHIGSGASRVVKADAEDLGKKLARPADTGKTEKEWNSSYWSSFGPQRSLAVLATQMYMSNARIIVNLCMSDLFDRYPKLKIASAESGIGWIPFILEAMEFQMDEMITDPGERSLQRRRPTDYFRDHIYVMFWFETLGPQKMLEDIGINNILVETDLPHPSCLYPGTRERFAKTMGHLDRSVVKRVLQDNAAELYKINVPQ